MNSIRCKIIAPISLLVLFIVSGCAHESAYVSSGKDIRTLRSFYVAKHAADSKGINILIANQIKSAGYASSTGEERALPANTDAIVTYQDRWQWDMTEYLYRLSVQFRNPADKKVWASGQSFKPSFERSTPEMMVKEVIEKIFSKTITLEERNLLNLFYEGKASLIIPGLISGTAEAFDYGAKVKERKELYDQKAWEALALSTLKTNYGDNIAWFYLGRAAEGLGYHNAALTYYEKSIELSNSALTRCMGPVCSGFVFPNAPNNRAGEVKKTIAAELKNTR
jgi:tetratricopeptide (TPR) repeat protein